VLCSIRKQSNKKINGKNMTNKKTITVKGTAITIVNENNNDFISITDMLKAKDGTFLFQIG
jgi:Tfp pilus assembly major pilin PilA